MVGALIGGYLGGRFGPKKVIQFHGLICSFGWLLMGFSPNLSLLIVGRLVVGFAQSLNMSNCSLLVAQYRSVDDISFIKNSHLRGEGEGVTKKCQMSQLRTPFY